MSAERLGGVESKIGQFGCKVWLLQNEPGDPLSDIAQKRVWKIRSKGMKRTATNHVIDDF